MYYSYKGAYPTQLPNRIVLSDGSTRTDKTTFTAEEIADAGWVEVSAPPAAQHPNKLEWNGSQWVVRAPNASEIAFKRQEIRNFCTRRLAETDYKVIKAYETGSTLDQAYATYRQELRDLYNNVINIDPWSVQYPTLNIPDSE